MQNLHLKLTSRKQLTELKENHNGAWFLFWNILEQLWSYNESNFWKIVDSVTKIIATSTLKNSAPSSKLLMKIDNQPNNLYA